jgi:hypothetical protein
MRNKDPPTALSRELDSREGTTKRSAFFISPEVGLREGQ